MLFIMIIAMSGCLRSVKFNPTVVPLREVAVSFDDDEPIKPGEGVTCHVQNISNRPLKLTNFVSCVDSFCTQIVGPQNSVTIIPNKYTSFYGSCGAFGEKQNAANIELHISTESTGQLTSGTTKAEVHLKGK